MKDALRYVEVSYRTPEEPMPRFRCVVTEAGSPDAAIQNARADVLRAHPDAYDVEEFLHRVLTRERALDITNQMHAETWEGWPM